MYPKLGRYAQKAEDNHILKSKEKYEYHIHQIENINTEIEIIKKKQPNRNSEVGKYSN